jgi:hypothetical protein
VIKGERAKRRKGEGAKEKKGEGENGRMGEVWEKSLECD